jgi:hypothetical protein
MFAGLVDLLAVVDVSGEASAPALDAALIRAGWVTLVFAPVTTLARRARPARVVAAEGRVTVRARGMSQALEPSEVAGASSAPLPGGHSVLVMPRRVGALPLIVDVAQEEDAHAVLAALGVVDVRALTGSLSWPLRRGASDVFRLAVAFTWRAAIVATLVSFPFSLLSAPALALAVTVLAGLLATALALAPSVGPHVELTAEQLRVFGGVERRGAAGERELAASAAVIPVGDVVEARATPDEILFRLRSGDTIAARAPIPRVSRRALSVEERTHLVVHVNAAAARAVIRGVSGSTASARGPRTSG